MHGQQNIKKETLCHTITVYTTVFLKMNPSFRNM